MKKIVKYSSLAALGLVAAGVLAACSGGEKKDAASGEATSGKKEIVVEIGRASCRERVSPRV